jgi:hypothetical protein
MPSARTIPFYPAPSPSRSGASPYPGLANEARKFLQGAGSALLVFNGANAMTGAEAAAGSDAAVIPDFTSVEGFLQTFGGSDLAGPAQIAAALFLFFAAGHSLSRFFGLAAAALVGVLYMKGVTTEEMLTFGEHFVSRVGAAFDAFMTAEV